MLKEEVPELKNRKLKISKVKRNIEQFNPLSIYVTGIGFNTTEMELGKFFEIYGDVNSVKLLQNKENQTIFSGFVNFENANSVEEALKADGKILKKSKIGV